MWIHAAAAVATRKVGPDALSKNKAIHTIIINSIAPFGNANYVREESENGGEQEAAIPLTGGFVRSVMVRVQLLFTHFCRRGRHVFASWVNLQTSGEIAGSFESGFSLNRRTLIRRKVQRAEANNVLLSTQCSCRGARKSQPALLTRSFHYERASPNGAETSSASQNRSHYSAPICWFTMVSSLKITPKMN